MKPPSFAILRAAAVLLAVTIVLSCRTAPAEEPAHGTTTVPAKAPPVVRTYDVQNLIFSVADFTDAPDLSAIQDLPGAPQAKEAGGFQLELRNASRAVELTRPQQVARFINWISGTITPEVWKSGGALRELNGKLTVVAPQETHDQLATLFDELHRRQKVQIVVTFRILGLAPADFKRLPAALAGKLNAAAFPFGPQAPVRMAENEINQLLRACESSADSSLISAPRMTLVNGQRAYVLVSTQTPFIAGYTPRKDGGFDPQVKTVECGLVCDVRATVADDRKQIALHLAAQQSELKGMGKALFKGAPDKKLMIEVPAMSVREIRALGVVADGQTILMGRAEDVSPAVAPDAAKPGAKPAQRIIMLVTAKVVAAE